MQLEGSLRVSNLGVCHELYIQHLLLTLSFPDACVPFSLCHANVSISLHHGSLRLAQGAQIVHFVIHVLDGEAEDLNAHAANVRGCHLPHQLGKLVPVLINLLHCQGTEDGAQMSLQGL